MFSTQTHRGWPSQESCIKSMNGSGRTVLRPIAYGSKVLSDTEMKYGAPKAEMFAVVTFVEKYRAYLGSAPFKLRVDNRALSWMNDLLDG